LIKVDGEAAEREGVDLRFGFDPGAAHLFDDAGRAVARPVRV
jgi:hypothetical protein